MIDLYYWPTPNGHKITLLLEEAYLPYRVEAVNIGKGDQFEKSFLKISPNNKMPAIVDYEPVEDSKPVTLFESGAILQYLADKTGRFLPRYGTSRYEVLQWLAWQVGGFGPMLGQNYHFTQYAKEQVPYAIKRYKDETKRLYKVLDAALGQSEFLGSNDYSIADMATFPWSKGHEIQDIDLASYPNVKRWMTTIESRPATTKAYGVGEQFSGGDRRLSDEAKSKLDKL